MIALRRAAVADVEAMTALVHAAYAPWIPMLGREPGPMLFDYAKAVEQHCIDLHYVGDTLAALIEMYPTSDHLVIVNAAVAPPYQGRGLGTSIMTHAELFAVSLGLCETRLFTNKLMASNLRLYERLGYRADGEEAFRGGTVVHMHKQLKA